MDYEDLAKEFMVIMSKMKKHHAHKKINDSLHGESITLYYIAHNQGNILPKDISNNTGSSTARVAATLKSLEKKGYITRNINPEDKRQILVELTDEGRKQVEINNQNILNITINMLEFLGENDAKEYVRITKRLSEIHPSEFEKKCEISNDKKQQY